MGMKGGFKAVLIGAIASLVLAAPAAAKTYEVNKRSDHAPNGCKKKDCTLREAVLAANAHAGSDRIVLPKRKTYNLSIPNSNPVGEAAGLQGDLDVTDDLKILHRGKGRAKIDANGIDRVLETDPSAPVDLALTRLTITGGDDPADINGGGIRMNDGSLKLKLSQLTDNVSDGNGGGVYVFASTTTMVVERSAVSGNFADGNGAGIYNFAGEIRTRVNRSTISDNTSTAFGGGLWVGLDSLQIENSTIDGNRATRGGGFYSAFDSEVSLNAVTVTRNAATASDGGGFLNASSVPLEVENSLNALNAASGLGDDCTNDPGSEIDSGGHNLLGSNTDCAGFDGPGDFVSSNPKLGTLKNNGGPTQTVALKKGSPAINKAGDSAPNKDQRGEKRGKKPDIGAYERVKKKRKKGRR
jgi:CSLREA domain-containing protein